MTDQPLDPPAESPSADEAAGSAEPLAPAVDLALRGVVREVEAHAAEGGWDQPPRLYALVLTEELLAAQPELASMVGVDPEADLSGSLTPVEQDALPADRSLEQLLTEVTWPPEVHGTAAVVERLVLPPDAGELPEDPEEAAAAAAAHPDRQEVRMVCGVTRAGSTYCALRLRAHDDDLHVIEGPDLVPALLELLQGTLAPTPGADADPAGGGTAP